MDTDFEIIQEKRKWPKIICYTFIGLVIVLALTFFGATMFAKHSLPQISGKIKLEGLKDKVIITRDNKGVPHI